MYVSYDHISFIKRAYDNQHLHLNPHQKDELKKVIHHSIGHANDITPSFASYSELFKEDF